MTEPGEVAFYAAPSPTSDLSRHADTLGAFVGAADEASRLARNVVVEVLDIAALGLQVEPGRLDEFNLRSAAQVVDRARELKDGELTAPRAPEERVLGNCHHLALLSCAFLRHAGVAARVRFGFAPYLVRGRHEDHCIAEAIVAGEWCRFDPSYGLEVGDPVVDSFVFAGEAWLRCRSGAADAEEFGGEDLFKSRDYRGLWFVQNSVVHDLASLCKVELHPCDFWGVMLGGDHERPPELLDEVARLTTTDEWAERLARFEGDAALHPVGQVSAYDALTHEMADVLLPEQW